MPIHIRQSTSNGQGTSQAASSSSGSRHCSSSPSHKLILVTVRKAVQGVLENPNSMYEDKLNAVLSAWELLAVAPSSLYSDDIINLAEYLIRETGLLVLHGDWSSVGVATKYHMLRMLQRFTDLLGTHPCTHELRTLTKLVLDPWGNPILIQVINNSTVSPADVVKFWQCETSCVLVLRLEVLTTYKCEDLALRLAHFYVRSSFSSPGSHFAKAGLSQHSERVMDFYVALLHKFKQHNKIAEEVLQMPLETGLQLVLRHARMLATRQHLWRHGAAITLRLAPFLISRTLAQEDEAVAKLLPQFRQIVTVWAALLQKEGTAPSSMAKQASVLVQHRPNTNTVYVFCSALYHQLGTELLSVYIDTFIRALTCDLNYLEKQKLLEDKQLIKKTEMRLANSFLLLAEIFQDNIYVCRESTLTAFSLYPTLKIYNELRKLAKSSKAFIQKTKQMSETPKECPGNSSDLESLVLVGGEQEAVGSDCKLLRPPGLLDAQALGLSKQTCEDLVVVLASVRWKLLSWDLTWGKLSTLCNKYLKNPQKMRCIVTELKHLKPDFSHYKDLPPLEIHENYGIEEGYEHLLHDGQEIKNKERKKRTSTEK